MQYTNPALENFNLSIDRLLEEDIFLASYPGAGSSWVSNIMLELGISYFDPYTEIIPDVSNEQNVFNIEYRKRFSALCKLDSGLIIRKHIPRVIKTHLLSNNFVNLSRFPKRAIVLVRHPVLSIISYYNWRLRFSEEGEPGSLVDFLDRPGINGVTPMEDWLLTYRSWLDHTKKYGIESIVLSFEKLRKDCQVEISKLCNHCGWHCSKADITRAVANSTFAAMRLHERAAFPDDEVGMMRGGAELTSQEAAPAVQLVSTYITREVRMMMLRLGYFSEE